MTEAEQERARVVDINSAEVGSIVTLIGTPWRVIGFIDSPAVLLERVGCEEVPTNQRTHQTVVLGSPFAEEWIIEREGE